MVCIIRHQLSRYFHSAVLILPSYSVADLNPNAIIMLSPQAMEKTEDHTEEVTTRCGFVYYL